MLPNSIASPLTRAGEKTLIRTVSACSEAKRLVLPLQDPSAFIFIGEAYDETTITAYVGEMPRQKRADSDAVVICFGLSAIGVSVS